MTHRLLEDRALGDPRRDQHGARPQAVPPEVLRRRGKTQLNPVSVQLQQGFSTWMAAVGTLITV